MAFNSTKFFYGSYTHDANSVYFKNISRTFIRGATQRQHLLRANWLMQGRIVGENPYTEVDAILSAYQVDGKSAGMSGTPFTINGKQALGGCRVSNAVSFSELKGAEGVTYLNYTFGLEADFLWALPNDILEFEETTSFTDSGGLPITVERLPMNAPPLLQAVTQSSWYFGTQTGHLTQPGPNPSPMLPLLGPYLRTGGNNGETITYKSPKMIKGNAISYTVQWSYNYINSFPMYIQPNALG